MRIRFIRLIRCFYFLHPNNLCISVKSVGEYAAINSVSSVCSVGECYYGGGLQRAQFLLGWCISCSVDVFLARLVHLRQVHPLSVPPFASAVQSVSVRRPIGSRPPSVEKCWEKRCKNVVLNGNTIGDFAIFDVSVFRCFYYPRPNHLCISEICGRILSNKFCEFCVFCGRPFRKPSMKSCFFVQFRWLLEKNAI